MIYGKDDGQLGNYNSSGPFSGAGDTPATKKVDDLFGTPTGAGTTTFAMSSTNEPGGAGQFTNDLDGRWDASLKTVKEYLTNAVTGVVNDLVLLFDNNQNGTTSGDTQLIWGQLRILKADGSLFKCYELDSGAAGCSDTGADPTPIAPTFNGDGSIATTGDYVAMLGTFCVKQSDGSAYNIGAANSGACNAGDFLSRTTSDKVTPNSRPISVS